MKNVESTIVNKDNEPKVGSYIAGFFASVLLTLLSFFPVALHVNFDHEWPDHKIMIFALILLALIQLFVQLFFFLHLGKSGSEYNTILFVFAALGVFVLVFGSLWIMNNLNYHMLPSSEIEMKVLHDEGIKR